jgi:hypothetical protein
MAPDRLAECLAIIPWSTGAIAEALDCHVSLIEAWLGGREEIPANAAAWIEAMITVHKAAEDDKLISLKRKGAKP